LNLTRLVRSSASLPFRALDTGVRAAAVAATVGVGLVTDPTRIATATPNDFVNAVTDVAAEIFGRTPSRRRWQGDRRCWIEVRGLDDSDPGDVLPQAVLRHVRDQPGVLRVDLNHALSRVVVHTDGTESLDELSDAVAAAERDADVDTTQPSINLPGDGIILASSITALTANTLGLATALVGRALMWPKLVPGLPAAVAFVDYQPRLRGLVEEWLGEDATDTALALAASIGYTLSQAPTSLAVDVFMHLVRVAEAQSAALAWQRHEPALAEYAESTDGIRPNERPQPLPSGPVERHGDRSSVIQGVGAIALGIATGGISGAATTALVAAPKAARNTREAFAGTLARGLADRHDVVPLRSNALRRLDRIDAVVIDPRVLWTDDLRVGRIRDVDDRRRAEVWQWAQDQIDADALTAGWHDQPNGDGRVLVRYATHTMASSVLREIRRSAIEVVSVDVDGLDDLRSSFDDLHPFDGPLDDALAASVRRLQDDGRTVALVSSAAAQALADADLAIGVAIDAACWHADVIADDLDGVWRVLHAIPAARRASERGVQLATGASVLGALLMVPGVRGRGPGPVTAGAGAGAWTGYRIARQVLGDPTPAPPPTLEWHAMSIEQVRRKLPRPERLPAPAQRSRVQATASTVTGIARAVGDPVRSNVADFTTAMKDELSDPLTPVLAIGSAASAVLGSPIDAILVGSVLTGNAALAAVQRLRAERLLKRLLAVQDPPARLLTEDGEETVDAVDLRPGDVIEVRPGEVVPADVRLTEATDLEVDESSLTGESLPVPKRLAATPAAPVAERSSMLHATTTVVAGTGVGIVTAVGSRTQARRAAQAPGRDNSSVGLQAQLRDLTNRALPVSLAGGALVTGLGILRGTGLRQAVSSGVAVSVAAVPEGLPLVATLAQQASARRLSGLGALVRSPRSVEALGRVDVVCFDKTGTLSENRLRVTSVAALDGTDEDVLRHAVRATPPANGDGHEHATDAAVAEAGDPDGNGTADAFLPFRSGRPFAASIHGTELSIKGAPEVLLAACGDAAATDRVQQMAADGLRVLAVARRDLTEAQAREATADADAFDALCREELRLVGLLGLSDTPRPDAARVLAGLAEQGIDVRLITGDHPVTATAIANELGLAVGADQVISGADWEALSRRGQEQAVRERIVFARMSPEHKVQIVETLERLDRVCAMVGDGANDAAAIRAATVGIGVASKGSDPARTAADVMLLDGRIGSLLDALEEGRQLWQRVQAAVSVLLGGNAGEVAFAVLGTALTGRAPLNTRQLLLVNMLTDALPAAALAVSPPTAPARGAGNGPDEAALWRTVAVRGATTAGAASVAWAMASVTGRQQRASTVALVALVATQLGQTLIDSHSPLVVGTAVGSLLTLGALISTPGVSQLLGSTPLGPVGWGQALTTAAGATAIAAIAPRVLGRASEDQPSPSTSSTPSRQSTAYSSRNGTVSTPVTTSVNGSEPEEATFSTLDGSDVHPSNTP
jgi:cation-transporting ATPase I